MSYIDTIPHEQLGSLAGYPLYHPLATRLAARGDYDFGCSSANVVLGGGSGEHPAMVVHQLPQLAMHYLLFRLETLSEDNPDDLQNALEFLEIRLLDRITPVQECLETCGWQLEQLAELVRRSQDASRPTPYSPKDHTSVEHWLAYSLGEWLWYCHPALLGPLKVDLTTAVPGLVGWLGDPVLRNVQPMPVLA
jgi:hypothetical protein